MPISFRTWAAAFRGVRPKIYSTSIGVDFMDFATAITILIDGLVFSSYLFLVSVGLTIIFGVMKILNVAHGSFYAWGAYTSAYLIGIWSKYARTSVLFQSRPALGSSRPSQQSLRFTPTNSNPAPRSGRVRSVLPSASVPT